MLNSCLLYTSCAILGVEPIFLDIEDHRLLDDRDCYEKVIAAMECLNPDVVFTCAPNDYHNDHRCLSRLVLNSAWAPVFFAETSCGVDFNPDFYVDITEFIETKIEMARQHQSQFTEDPKETIEIVNRFRALQCRRKEIRYAECFKLYKRFEWVKALSLIHISSTIPGRSRSPILRYWDRSARQSADRRA